MTYEHRNGESESPTIDGDYWFAGDCTEKNTNFGEIKELVSVYSLPEGAASAGRWVQLPMRDGYGESDYKIKPDSFSGRWWGPVYAPWDEDKE